MSKSVAVAIFAWLRASLPRPAIAEIIHSDGRLSGRKMCWWSQFDSEQYHRDHTYVYTYHVHIWIISQYVVRGVWSVAPDGVVTVKLDGGGAMVRKYEVNGDRLVELTGTLDGGREGYFC